MNLQERLSLNTDLDCAVANRFVLRPTLYEVCARLLVEQWLKHQISDHDPLSLYLVSTDSTPQRTYSRRLFKVLAERFCRRATLNLTPEEDFLSLNESLNPQGAVDIDLHAVEQLINETGPFLQESYQRALVDFWSEADRSGQSPWQWYADYLKQQFKSAIDMGFDAGVLSQADAAAAHLVYTYPSLHDRNLWPNTGNLSVQHLMLDTSASAYLDRDLASALLIQRLDTSTSHNTTLVYSTTGEVLPLASQQALFTGLGRLWPALTVSRPQLQLTHITNNCFEAQARGVLDQQLRVITALMQQYQSEYSAPLMSMELDRMTSMIGLCSAAEQERRTQLANHLPDWLSHSKGPLMRRYGAMLLDVAQSYEDAAGQFWLDGIDDAETFSYQQLARQINIDHPGSELDVRDVVVINHQVIATAIPSQDSLITDGTVRPVRFSLAQLAIGNLGLLAPGRIELVSATGHALPSWMDEGYMRQLVSKLDIGSAYPQMLTHNMLDDADQRQLRQQLFDAQLRTQIPAYALELHLRDNSLSDDAVSGITQVFNAQPRPQPSDWVMRPLGLISQAGATPDEPHNCWLIETQRMSSSPCVLYRPLHPQPLLEFSDRLAVLEAISSSGDLQDDLLERLPEASRRIYANGGFLEPHLYLSVEDDFAVPFGAPRPPSLSQQTPVANIGSRLYQTCVEEAIRHFQAQSRSTAATRWKRWETLGWLLFNTLLPLAGGTLARAAWLVQMSVALADFINTDAQRDPTGHRIALINLLVNVAVVLFSHAYQGLRLDLQNVAPLPALAPDQAVTPLEPGPASVNTLAFSWARPDHTLDAAQHLALVKLQANVSLSQLGSPVPKGPLRGLYLYGDQLWAHLDNQVYRVSIDPHREQPRIVAASPSDAPGPWLIRDEVGRWQLDLALRLRGGMPLSRRVQEQKLQRQQAYNALKTKFASDTEQVKSQKATRDRVLGMAATATDERLMRSCLEKTQGYAKFWREYLHTLEEVNEHEPVPHYKVVRATALYELVRSEQSNVTALTRLFRPLRAQLVDLAKQHSQQQAFPEADSRIINHRLDAMSPLLDQMIAGAEVLTDARRQLNRLASRQQTTIAQLNDWVQTNREEPSTHLMWRYLRVENHFNRLKLLHSLDDQATYWLDCSWKNLELGIAQRVRLSDLEEAGIELQVRLLRSISDQMGGCLRQLGNLKSLLIEPAALQALAQLQADVEHIAEGVRQDLAELPDYPVASTVQQLRSQVPGLIDTTEHGLLLAEPRVDDDTLVDIPGPDNKTATRTYRREQEDWVEVSAVATPEPATRTTQSLKRLLRNSRIYMANARKTLHSLQTNASTSYLPVEIEELLQHHKTLLNAEREAIEQHLTDDNQTDEATVTDDGALTMKALDELVQTLTSQTLELRTQAALRQNPRMAEVQYLIDRGQIQVRAVGPRRHLAKVKGRADDYLDEYEISHQGTALWYAHFHYQAMNTPREAFVAGHLKTADQRLAAGASVTDASGRSIDVYRAPVTAASAAKYFFNL
ncbi:DUF6543 domain-containing protein [Pseudomonas tussilaginis]|uniref:DUF6543 domain-containing protein n=1 Tax=Pseudomonas sp. 5 TaxID=1619949 RepID=UPI0005EAC8D2|nr:DUF6543 domain-containing protein [Pseudomonas sp. 5]KJK05436.1 hypothetical protein UB47_20475 [Pseudomonas sp. 5]